MSVAISMNYSAYSCIEMSNTQAKTNEKAGIVDNPNGSQGFDRVLMGNTPKELEIRWKFSDEVMKFIEG